MKMFAESLIKIGQSIPPSMRVYIEYLLPSAPTVRSSMVEITRSSRENLKSNLINILKGAADMKSDGVKGYVDGKKYYDLVIHYYDQSARGLKSNVLFLAEHKESSDSAISIRNTSDSNLHRHYGMKLDDLDDKITYVTDCAPVMACVFKSSI